MGPILYGATTVVPSDVFLAGASLEALSKERCTVILAVATMLQALLDHPDADLHEREVCLRTGVVAGSTLSPVLIKRLKEKFAFTGLAYGYGRNL